MIVSYLCPCSDLFFKIHDYVTILISLNQLTACFKQILLASSSGNVLENSADNMHTVVRV